MNIPVEILVMETNYIYNNKKSRLNGQEYIMHLIDGRVYLTPNNGKSKTQVRMPYNTFIKAVKQGYYTKQL